MFQTKASSVTSLEYLWGLGRHGPVGVATRYGLDGPRIESRWGRDFPHPSRPTLGPPSLLYNGYRVFPGGKAAGAWRWPPTPSSAVVDERVELYLYSPSGPSWPVLGWTLPLPFTLPLKLFAVVSLTHYKYNALLFNTLYVHTLCHENEMGWGVGMWRIWGRGEGCTGFWWGNLRERDQWVDPDADGRIILKWILRK